MSKNDYRDLLRLQKFPPIWCAGCGNGIVLQSLTRAVAKTGWDQDKICLVSGIGCSSRISGYADFNTLHTTHGRALTFATGIKMANPELHVIVVSGDGDALAIGGNHFLHAARRNVDLTYLIINNLIYGMTGGQASPATPTGKRATTSPYGHMDTPLDPCALAIAAGAPFVARSTTFDARNCEKYIRKGLEKPGFSVIEVAAACPTSYGRMNKCPDASGMLLQQEADAMTVKQAAELPPEEVRDKVITGILHNEDRPEASAAYHQMVAERSAGR
ncbi:MAG: 2-oxoacid:ferredoxin oxidoreductase subunit beta [Fimbriimonadaceae bacterium]